MTALHAIAALWLIALVAVVMATRKQTPARVAVALVGLSILLMPLAGWPGR